MPDAKSTIAAIELSKKLIQQFSDKKDQDLAEKLNDKWKHALSEYESGQAIDDLPRNIFVDGMAEIKISSSLLNGKAKKLDDSGSTPDHVYYEEELDEAYRQIVDYLNLRVEKSKFESSKKMCQQDPISMAMKTIADQILGLRRLTGADVVTTEKRIKVLIYFLDKFISLNNKGKRKEFINLAKTSLNEAIKYLIQADKNKSSIDLFKEIYKESRNAAQQALAFAVVLAFPFNDVLDYYTQARIPIRYLAQRNKRGDRGFIKDSPSGHRKNIKLPKYNPFSKKIHQIARMIQGIEDSSNNIELSSVIHTSSPKNKKIIQKLLSGNGHLTRTVFKKSNFFDLVLHKDVVSREAGTNGGASICTISEEAKIARHASIDYALNLALYFAELSEVAYKHVINITNVGELNAYESEEAKVYFDKLKRNKELINEYWQKLAPVMSHIKSSRKLLSGEGGERLEVYIRFINELERYLADNMIPGKIDRVIGYSKPESLKKSCNDYLNNKIGLYNHYKHRSPVGLGLTNQEITRLTKSGFTMASQMHIMKYSKDSCVELKHRPILLNSEFQENRINESMCFSKIKNIFLSIYNPSVNDSKQKLPTVFDEKSNKFFRNLKTSINLYQESVRNTINKNFFKLSDKEEIPMPKWYWNWYPFKLFFRKKRKQADIFVKLSYVSSMWYNIQQREQVIKQKIDASLADYQRVLGEIKKLKSFVSELEGIVFKEIDLVSEQLFILNSNRKVYTQQLRSINEKLNQLNHLSGRMEGNLNDTVRQVQQEMRSRAELEPALLPQSASSNVSSANSTPEWKNLTKTGDHKESSPQTNQTVNVFQAGIFALSRQSEARRSNASSEESSRDGLSNN